MLFTETLAVVQVLTARAKSFEHAYNDTSDY